jgi:hypothetical protein
MSVSTVHRGRGKMRGKTRRNNLRSSNYKEQIVKSFLQFLITIKLYHWNTFSYSTHKATDDLYSKLNEGIDSFVEVLLGKNDGSRINISKSQTISMRNYSSNVEIKREANDFKRFLVGLNSNPNFKTTENSDLFNIRDEILQNVNQFLYLLSLK